MIKVLSYSEGINEITSSVQNTSTRPTETKWGNDKGHENTFYSERSKTTLD